MANAVSCRDCGRAAQVGNPLFPTPDKITGKFVHLKCPSYRQPTYKELSNA